MLPTADQPITMFTTSWCGFCVRLKSQLARENIVLREIDIETDADAAHFVENHNGGNQTVPTLLFADGSTLTNPALATVRAHLAEVQAKS
ncbi:MAG: glutaredoxin domain-containing protein [Actinomycetes bacterium]|jgi:mycoredoxin